MSLLYIMYIYTIFEQIRIENELSVCNPIIPVIKTRLEGYQYICEIKPKQLQRECNTKKQIVKANWVEIDWNLILKSDIKWMIKKKMSGGLKLLTVCVCVCVCAYSVVSL